MTRGNDDELSTILSVPFDPTPPADASYRVEVIAGADVGRAFVVDGVTPGRVFVGTGPACALPLRDRTISRRHLALEAEETRLRVTDLGSKNGTRVNELAVRDVLLAGGERIVIGGTTLGVTRLHATTASLGTDTQWGLVVGGSREMRRLFPVLARLASSDVPVLLEGETGTGKRLVAATIHGEGSRADRPFAELACASLTDTTFDAELAQAFAEVRDGTLFVDEIGELSGPAQVKLIRAFERPTPFRVVASTRHDLDEAVVRGRFRDDLFHWLAVGRVELPPLRARRGDVPLLVAHFCRELGGDPSTITKELLATWQAHRFPGNVRELRSAVSKRLTLGALAEVDAPRQQVRTDDGIAALLAEKLPLADARARVVEAFERRYVEHMLRETGGNVARAAAASGVARRYFQILKSKRGF